MSDKWVLIPFSGEDDRGSVQAYNQQWGDRRVSAVANTTKSSAQLLKKVGDNDTVYIQTHGYTNDFTCIGGSGGNGSKRADQIAALLLAMLPDTRPARLKVKVFSCFSGFGFAKEVFLALKTELPDVAVYGYKGETQVTARGTSKQVLRVPDKLGKPGDALSAYVQTMTADGYERKEATVVASDKLVRIVYTASAPNGKAVERKADPWDD
jgi:hypothetical protein